MHDFLLVRFFIKSIGGDIVTSITIKIDDIEKQLLQEYAEDNDLTISQVVRRLIKDLLDEKFDR